MAHQKDFNYRITEFFLTKTRLTILSLFLLIVVGVGATLSLKTVGFPSPEIQLALVNTAYPGAEANTVLEEVTEPLQRAIDGVEGVEEYSSTTRDSFSSIFVTIESDAEAGEVRTSLQEAAGKVDLPEEVEAPEVIAPEIGGADVYLSVYQPDLAVRYESTRELSEFINDLDGTEEMIFSNELSRQLALEVDTEALRERGLGLEEVERAILTQEEQTPVVTDVTLDDTQQAVVTSIEGNLTPDSLGDIEITSAPSSAAPNTQGPTPPTSQTTRLGDVSSVEEEFVYAEENPTLLGITGEDGETRVVETTALAIKTRPGVDQSAYFAEITEFIEEQDFWQFSQGELPVTNDTVVISNYTVAEDNEQQVGEVLSGLIGGPLPIESPALAQIGWLLGGIQLVFLVMLAFVSWRAAIIAAASIPLSLVFTNIYLFLIGENLNTLVLFSFVLVIGLVVDPALVILESIQRKIDAGFRGKAAALEAVKDVGLGLFLATLTNIIVFTPFGIVSGILGQIFQNIPLTIIPAVIGSYVVPLVFLSWIGSAFMRRGKNTAESEVDNLWGIAKGLIRLNQKILDSSWWVRGVIIVAGLGLALATTGWAFSSGAVRSVQFASGDDEPYLTVQNQFVSGLSPSQRQETTSKLLEIIVRQPEVTQVFQSDEFGTLARMDEERETTTREVVDRINGEIGESEILQNNFLDVQADVLTNGPPEPLYQVSVAVQDQDLDLVREASLEIGQTLQTICEVDGEFRVNECEGEKTIVEKVDDGYTGQTTSVLNYVLNRESLVENNLLSPQGPAGILVNQALRRNFPVSTTRDALTSVASEGEELDLIVRPSGSDVTLQRVLNNTNVTNLQGEAVDLETVAEVSEEEGQRAISQTNGETINTVQLRLSEDFADQGTAARVTAAIVEYYQADDFARTKDLGLSEEAVGEFSQGGSAEFLQSFQELLLALVLAIFFSYFVLAAFFNSLTEPLTILYTVPLTFIGVFPAIAFLSNGQFGLLEIIGLIILVGLVENVAIFLIDNANQLVLEGMDKKEAIATASGIRLRPVILTNFTAIASLAPLAFLSETYRPLSLVIIFGLLTSGVASLITTPILYIFFRWLSRRYRQAHWVNKILFFPLFPLYIIYWGVKNNDDEDTEDTDSDSPNSKKISHPVDVDSKNKTFFNHPKHVDYQKIKEITRN